MPSPDATKIVIKCKEPQRDEVKRLAQLHGKTIQRYALDRLLLPWTDRDLEDLGFGLVLRAFREKQYPDHYIKRFCGETLRAILDSPVYTVELDRLNTKLKEKRRSEEIEREYAKMAMYR